MENMLELYLKIMKLYDLLENIVKIKYILIIQKTKHSYTTFLFIFNFVS